MRQKQRRSCRREWPAGYFEVCSSTRRFVTEGSFTNIFVERGENLSTPRLARPRGECSPKLIDEGRAQGRMRPEIYDRACDRQCVRGLMRGLID